MAGAGYNAGVNHSPLTAVDSTPGQRLRLLSYNVQVGISTTRYRHYLTHGWKHVLPFPERARNLARIAHFVSAFDVVGLQELDAGSLRSGFVNYAEYLSQHAGLRHWYSQVNRNLARIARHSQGMLSRFPLRTVTEHRLPGAIPGRGAMEVHLGVGEESLVIIQVHLALVRRTRARQLDYVAEPVQQHPHVVVMGDFNCLPTSPEFRRLLAKTHLCEPHVDSCTYPSWQPLHCFDHILATPELKVEHGTVFQVTYSDHLPVGLDITLPPGLRLDYEPHGASTA